MNLYERNGGYFRLLSDDEIICTGDECCWRPPERDDKWGRASTNIGKTPAQARIAGYDMDYVRQIDPLTYAMRSALLNKDKKGEHETR